MKHDQVFDLDSHLGKRKSIERSYTPKSSYLLEGKGSQIGEDEVDSLIRNYED
eukprot:CAMPEP_0205803108 /NCGR_PEP_ID=MMETSP0205-20121125/5651_1 /ASSEMBLY_ACC=CAM_ASM_000278 /TAXON_ID=36767 /ORGANISM="Euplotes focardii, Strain TN1" /LENGTH=52 /DNA_ID=CAMNT_0053070635 /DNA_START=655 /DNA_END=810 /DNA_ORIENTATION=+